MNSAPLKRFYIHLASGKTFTAYATLKALSDFKLKITEHESEFDVLLCRPERDSTQLNSQWFRLSQIDAIEIPDIGGTEEP